MWATGPPNRQNTERWQAKNAGRYWYRDNASKRPHSVECPGALFSSKTGKFRSKRPLSKQKCEKRPSNTVNAPPIIFGGKHPGAELASHLSVGDGAVSEAGEGLFYIGKLKPGVWVGTCFAQQLNKVRRGQKTKHVLDVLPSKNSCHSAIVTSSVLALGCGVYSSSCLMTTLMTVQIISISVECLR